MALRLNLNAKKSSLKSFRSLLLIHTLLLLAFGVIAVYNASVVDAFNTFGNKYHFAIQQIKWTGIGLVSMFLVSRIPPVFFKKFAPHIMIATLILMVAVLIPGLGSRVLGARRWINIGGFTLQPSEFMKLALVIYLASWLEKPRPITSFMAVILPILGLVMLQPDLGTAIIIAATGFLLYFISGAPVSKLLGLTLTGFLGGALLILSSSYRRARLLTFLDPTNDPLGSSYHINQVLIALGSGGLTGVGLGRSRQKYQYLPEATTDSIFAIIGEETGFIGCILVIGFLVSLVLLCFKLASQCQNRFNQLIVAGIASWLAAQVFLNISAMVALVPLTGIPLPLISYGGSSLITVLTGIGILLSVIRHEHI
jgi:cell division protein FtsW